MLLLAPAAGAQEWFDAYERGVKALAEGQADRAIELLEKAAKKRPEPGENLLTYGTNRLARYEPYVKLAEAYLAAGRAEDARQALARSTQRGRERANERTRVGGLVEQALARARAAAAPPPTAPPAPVVAAQLPATPAPTLAAAPAAAPPVVLATPAPPAPEQHAPATTAPARPGTLKLLSDPAGATVSIDGRPLGSTPLVARVPAGDHQVTVRREGFVEQTFPVRVEAGAVADAGRRVLVAAAAVDAAPTGVAAATTVSTKGELVLYTTPPGAHFYLDDEYLGQGDPGLGRLRKSDVAAGAHTIRAVRGEQNVEQPVDVVAGKSTTVRLTLPTPEPAGLLPGRLAAALAAVLALLGGGVWWLRRSPAAEPETRMIASRAAAAGPRTAARTPSRTPARTSVAAPTLSSAPTLGTDSAIDSTEAFSAGLTPHTPVGTHETFGPFVLTAQLGRGGMASVFRAERNGTAVALKRPLRGFLDEPEFLERFLREAEIGRTLHHHNIIRIFERGEVEGVPYFTMELVDGDTLSAYVRKRGALPAREAAAIVAQVAEALDYAHLKGIVHRDLKPSNIMLMADGTVKVMDYGIARSRRFDGLTVTGAFLGTPDYVAPETAEGHGTDARSDLYSLGIVFYEILTGQRPFVGETPFATLKKHCTEPPTPPSLIAPGTPRELEAVILKLLRKDPAERYPGAEELLIELRDYINRAA